MKRRTQSFGLLNKIAWDPETDQLTLYFETVGRKTDMLHLIALSDVQFVCWGDYTFTVSSFASGKTLLPTDNNGAFRFFAVVSFKIKDPPIEVAASDASAFDPDDVSLSVSSGEILLYPTKKEKRSMKTL